MLTQWEALNAIWWAQQYCSAHAHLTMDFPGDEAITLAGLDLYTNQLNHYLEKLSRD